MPKNHNHEKPAIRLGLIGAAGRGGTLGRFASHMGLHVAAACDINPDQLKQAQIRFESPHTFTDYEAMLDSGLIDAVVIGTPMHLHADQAIAALKRDIHVLSEVTAAVSIDQCKQLVQATETSQAIYMMAENYIYTRPNMFIAGLVNAGLFGDVYYAEGEYIHELKELCEQTTWRRQWQSGTHGITYPTHSLGPILQWFEGDRVARVCCAESGSHHQDPRGKPYACDTAVMLAQTTAGRLIKIRIDIVSDRPHAMTNYQLQGTDGAYESSRGGPCDRGKVWLRSLNTNCDDWLDNDTLMTQSALRQYLPQGWRDAENNEALHDAGHGGSDYFVFQDFAKTIRNEIPCPIDIHRAMDMTLPGIISEQSVKNSQWVDVPDSRSWCSGNS